MGGVLPEEAHDSLVKNAPPPDPPFCPPRPPPAEVIVKKVESLPSLLPDVFPAPPAPTVTV